MIQMLLLTMVVICTLAGCVSEGATDTMGSKKASTTTASSERSTDSGEATVRDDKTVKVRLESKNGSTVRGSATFARVAGGIEVKLAVRNLPDPNTVYLAHIHQGTCADQREVNPSGDSHGHHDTSVGEIEYPLSMVGSDSQGDGSSTTMLWDTTIDQLFSGGPEYVNVHASGQGDPPALACGNLS